MKTRFTFLLVLVSFFASSQQQMKTYINEWKKIDSLIVKAGLTQSALTAVNSIYTAAIKETNNVQALKALVYQAALSEEVNEEAPLLAIRKLEQQLTILKEPARSVLNSVIAGRYWMYFQQNRWRFYNRTATLVTRKDDMTTWSPEDFHEAITSRFIASLSNEKLLQSSALEPFDPLINKTSFRQLRPTLYDLLANRALKYFQNDERNITKPSYAFEIDNDTFFADANTFAIAKFTSPDTLSPYYSAISIYQELLRFHQDDKAPGALVDADVNRIQFVYQHAVMPGKDTLYLKALQSITTRYPNLPSAAQAAYLEADVYADRARTYRALENEVYRFEWAKAKAICEKIITQSDSSEGKSNAINLLQEINRRDVYVEVEKVNLPAQPFRARIGFRNVTKLYGRIVAADRKLQQSLNTIDRDQYWRQLLALPAIKTFEQTLPDTKDHQLHSTEIAIEALPVGEYALITSTMPDFRMNQHPLTMSSLYVSAIAWIHKGNDYFILHRETGKPLAGANAQVWYNNYDYAKGGNILAKGDLLTADKNGYIQIRPAAQQNRPQFLLEVTTKDDKVFTDDAVYNTYRLEPQNTTNLKNNSFLFLDRSVYRPGQVVYFKGIMVTPGDTSAAAAIVPGYKTTVILYDVNGEKADSAQVITNEYGSYSGKFTLPASVLNGQFRITDSKTNSSRFFSVEEYKRPKFEVSLQAPKGTYQLNDSITVAGIATAYAGNLVNGAAVKYRIVRRAIYPMWVRGGLQKMIWPPYPQNEIEIGNGQTTTDAAGNFSIVFKALPDKDADRKLLPVFNYSVTADITDITGETRSTASIVSVGYHSLNLQLQLPELMHADSLKSVNLTSANLNDVFVKTDVTLRLTPLLVPARLFRERLWAPVDQFVMDEKTYAAAFPYDVYRNENEPSNWQRLNTVINISDTTSEKGILALPSIKLQPGWFELEVSARDKSGDTIRTTRFIQLYRDQPKGPAMFTGINPGKQEVIKNQPLQYQLSSNLDDLFIIHDVQKGDRPLVRSFVTGNDIRKRLQVTVTPRESGEVLLDLAFVKFNRVFTAQKVLEVSDSSKMLNITYETFRDKTLPGSKETWKLKVNGSGKDKAVAEILTGMYDASLDQIMLNQWHIPNLRPYSNNRAAWVAPGFAVSHGQQHRVDIEYSGFVKNYELFTFDSPDDALVLYPGNPIGLAGGRMGVQRAMSAAVPELAKRDMNMADMAPPPQSTGFAENEADTSVPAAPAAEPVSIRRNFNETAFFFPDLKTDANGNIEFSFEMPEALTRWKWMTLAHTKELAFASGEKSIVTQKELMVQPSATRFIRQGDRIDFTGKISNLTDKEVTGQVELQLIDPTTNQSVDGWFKNVFPNQFFTAPANQSVPVSFSIEIPYQYNKALTYRMIARAGDVSDGEEGLLPVLSNRILLTESLQLPLRGPGTKDFKLNKLINSGNSETLNSHSLTVEYTSNPAWYAVQALPYLSDYPRASADQAFNRFYANGIAKIIINASPKIAAIFAKWNMSDTAAMFSQLEKNPALKAVLLAETPWVLEAKTEAAQRRQLAALFDLANLQRTEADALAKLSEMQSPNGSFMWFPGGPDDRFITQYILTGIGHLYKLDPKAADNKTLALIVSKGLSYLDKNINSDYTLLVKNTKQGVAVAGGLGNLQIQYLYLRSFFRNYPMPGSVIKAFSHYRVEAQKTWLKQSRYMQGMIALALHRTDDIKTGNAIVASLKQNAIVNEETGMYWKDNKSGYYWHQAPVETQAVLIEAFAEIAKDSKSVADMKTWLLKQKQTQSWSTTRATADACYALFLSVSGNSQAAITGLLTTNPAVTIKLGPVSLSASSEQQDAGSGYFQKTYSGEQLKPAMGNIQVTVGKTVAADKVPTTWGAVYWQYFENLDLVTAAGGPLTIRKQLMVETNTANGPLLKPINNAEPLHVGDKVVVRIEIKSDRDLEYVHLKDMRAANMEPVNILSSYKWQDGLGYYQSTGDAATNFYFDRLNKGTYVFEYPVFITHTGTFLNGIGSIQCLYAPEFASHSEGIKVSVE